VKKIAGSEIAYIRRRLKEIKEKNPLRNHLREEEGCERKSFLYSS